MTLDNPKNNNCNNPFSNCFSVINAKSKALLKENVIIVNNVKTSIFANVATQRQLTVIKISNNSQLYES